MVYSRGKINLDWPAINRGLEKAQHLTTLCMTKLPRELGMAGHKELGNLSSRIELQIGEALPAHSKAKVSRVPAHRPLQAPSDYISGLDTRQYGFEDLVTRWEDKEN